ncbi:MAG: hypothetical protein F4Z77_01380, partial [Dehalococcoidia bacterium]|nr:hypothetical protein [Dehalococcoidia bacterium]
MIALYRFWPEVRATVREAVEGASPASSGDGGLSLAEVTTTLGAYDLAVDIGEAGSAGEAASLALGVAEAVVA